MFYLTSTSVCKNEESACKHLLTTGSSGSFKSLQQWVYFTGSALDL